MTVTLFFGWSKVGVSHFDIFNCLSNPSWQSLSTSLLKTYLFSFGTRYYFVLYGLVYGYIYIYTGWLFHIPWVMLNKNSYFINTLCSIDCFYCFKCFISDATLCRLGFSYWASNMQHLHRVVFGTCSLSHRSSFQNSFPLRQLDDKLKLFLGCLSLRP